MEEKRSSDFDPFFKNEVNLVKIKNYTSIYDIEQWYEDLKDLTFNTKCLPISPEESKVGIFVCF